MKIPQLIIDTFGSGFKIGEQLESNYTHALELYKEAEDNLTFTANRLQAHKQRMKDLEQFMNENGYIYHGVKTGWQKKQQGDEGEQGWTEAEGAGVEDSGED